MKLPKIVIKEDQPGIQDDDSGIILPPTIPGKIPSFSNLPDAKRSVLKSNLRAYEADPVKLTPGLDPTQLSTSPVFNQQASRVRFASTDHIFQVSENDQIIRRGLDQLHFVLPLNSPLMRPNEISNTFTTTHNNDDNNNNNNNNPENLNLLTSSVNRFQTPPLAAQSAGAPMMNSPYSRMCDQLEHFVDAEIENTDNLLFNRPISERNVSVDLSPELEKASLSSNINNNNNNSSNNTASPPTLSSSNPPMIESRSLWLGNVDPTITEQEIRSTFEPFGLIENIRLLPAKECAFVNYFDMESAIRGRNAMQGKPLGNMILRIGFGKISDNSRDNSTTNNNLGTGAANINSSTANNNSRSVWIGNLGPEITSDLLMHHFNIFGPIESCRVLDAKSCAFVNFYSVEAAAMAKIKMNGAVIGNSTIKTGNVKESGSNNNTVSNTNNTNNMTNEFKNQNKSHQQSQTITFASIIQGTGDGDGEESESDSVGSCGDGAQLREYRRQVEAAPEEIPAILKKLMKRGDLNELAVDSYGNILLQKIIERAQLQEQALIMNSLKGHMVDISKQKNGTWVIQKLVTCATDLSIQSGTIEELRDHTVELLEDQFGNYVIQCILAAGLDSEDENMKIIVDKIVQNSRKLAIGKYSSRALKSILDTSTPSRQKLLSQSLAKESVLLSVDPNGAVVIQWILDSEMAGKVGMITGQLQGRLAQVALTKQGGVIVARIIGSVEEPNFRDSAILELYELTTTTTTPDNPVIGFNPPKSNYLDSLLAEPSTCSILFKAYQVSKPAIRLRLAGKLKPKLLEILKNVTGVDDVKVIESFSDAERDEKIPVHLIKIYQELIKK